MAKSNDEVLKDLIHMRRHIMNYIPTTLDNSMSYYELLGKILDYMVNNIGGGFTKEDIENIITQWVNEHDIFAPRGVVEFNTTEDILNAQDGYYTSKGTGFPDTNANYFLMVCHNQVDEESERLSDIFAIDSASATIWYLNNGGDWTSIEKFAPRGSMSFDTIAEVQALKDGYYTATGEAFPITNNPYFVQVYHTTPGLIDIFATDANTSRMYYLTSGGDWTLMFDGKSTDANWRNGGIFTGTIADLPSNGELVYYSISGDIPITGMGVEGGFIYCLGNSWLVAGVNGDNRKLIKSNGSVVDLMPTINGFPNDNDIYLYNSRLFSLTKPFIAGYKGVSATNWQNTILKDVVNYDSSNVPRGIIIAMPERNDSDETTILTKSIIYNFSTNQTFICMSTSINTFTIEEIGGAGIFKPQGTTTFANISAVQNAADGYYTASGAGLPTSSDNYFLQIYHSTESTPNIVDCIAANSATGDIYYLTSGGSWSKVNFNGKWLVENLPTFPDINTLKQSIGNLQIGYAPISTENYYSPVGAGGYFTMLGYSLLLLSSQNNARRIVDLETILNNTAQTTRLTTLLLDGMKTTTKPTEFYRGAAYSDYDKRFACAIETFTITDYSSYRNSPFYNTGIFNYNESSTIDIKGFKLSIPDIDYRVNNTSPTLETSGYTIFVEITTGTIIFVRGEQTDISYREQFYQHSLSYGSRGFHETPTTINNLLRMLDGYYTMQGGIMPTAGDPYLVQIFHTSIIDNSIVDIIALNSTNGNMYYLTSGGTWTLINNGGGGGSSITITRPTITNITNTAPVNAVINSQECITSNGIFKYRCNFKPTSDSGSITLTVSGSNVNLLNSLVGLTTTIASTSDSTYDGSYDAVAPEGVCQLVSANNNTLKFEYNMGSFDGSSDYLFNFICTVPMTIS